MTYVLVAFGAVFVALALVLFIFPFLSGLSLRWGGPHASVFERIEDWSYHKGAGE